MVGLRARVVILVTVVVAVLAALACGPDTDGCWDPDPDCIRLGGHWDEGCKNCIGRPSPAPPAQSQPSCVDRFDAAAAVVDAGDASAAGICGEAVCVPTVRGIGSHFTGPRCTGIESYYTPYNDCDGIRRSWDGKGLAGTILRTETNRSFKTDTGTCRDDWPDGNTLSGFVRIYR